MNIYAESNFVLELAFLQELIVPVVQPLRFKQSGEHHLKLFIDTFFDRLPDNLYPDKYKFPWDLLQLDVREILAAV